MKEDIPLFLKIVYIALAVFLSLPALALYAKITNFDSGQEGLGSIFLLIFGLPVAYFMIYSLFYAGTMLVDSIQNNIYPKRVAASKVFLLSAFVLFFSIIGLNIMQRIFLPAAEVGLYFLLLLPFVTLFYRRIFYP